MRHDFPEFEVLNAKLRRERAAAVYAFVIAPIAKLFSHSAPAPRAMRAKHRHA